MFFTTGCVKSSYNIEIDKKGNVKTSQIQALNVSLLKTFDPEIDKTLKKQFNEKKQELEKNGFKAEFYSEEGFSGVKKTKDFKIKNFKNSDLPTGYSCENKAPVIFDRRAFSDVYTVELTFDPQKVTEENKKNSAALKKDKKTPEKKENEPLQAVEQSDSEIAQNEPEAEVPNKENAKFEQSIEDLAKNNPQFMPSMELVIKTPYKASSHNATKVVNEKEYHWVFTSKEPVEIKLVFGKICISKILLVLISLGLFGFLVYRFNEYKNTSNW